MPEPFKDVKDFVCVFDSEYVPDIVLGRKIYHLPDDMKSADVLAEMYKRAKIEDNISAIAKHLKIKDTNPQPMLKLYLYRIVSISCVLRRISGKTVNLKIFTLPDSLEVSEAEMITRFLTFLGDNLPQLVGYASNMFDITVLMQRALINNCKIPKFFWRPDKPWEGPDYFARNSDWHIDLANSIGGFIPNSTPKLDEIARACGIPGKLGVDGSEVADMYFAGRLKDIINYNETDSATQYLLWLKVAEMMGKLPDGLYQAERRIFYNILKERADNGVEHWIAYLKEWELLDPTIAVAQIPEGEAPVAETPSVTVGEVAERVREVLAGGTAPTEEPVKELVTEPIGVSPGPAPENGFPANPIAKSLSDLCTSRQQGMLRAIAREIGIDADAECQKVMRCKTDELSKRAASALIQHLQDIQKGEYIKTEQPEGAVASMTEPITVDDDIPF